MITKEEHDACVEMANLMRDATDKAMERECIKIMDDAKYNLTDGKRDIPNDIIQAAIDVSEYMDSLSPKGWKLAGCASRRHLEYIEEELRNLKNVIDGIREQKAKIREH